MKNKWVFDHEAIDQINQAVIQKVGNDLMESTKCLYNKCGLTMNRGGNEYKITYCREVSRDILTPKDELNCREKAEKALTRLIPLLKDEDLAYMSSFIRRYLKIFLPEFKEDK